jgi:hypothetical protein
LINTNSQLSMLSNSYHKINLIPGIKEKVVKI